MKPMCKDSCSGICSTTSLALRLADLPLGLIQVCFEPCSGEFQVRLLEDLVDNVNERHGAPPM